MLKKVSVLCKQGRFAEIVRIAQNARTQEADRPTSARKSSAENIDSKAVSILHSCVAPILTYFNQEQNLLGILCWHASGANLCLKEYHNCLDNLEQAKRKSF